MEQAVVLLIIVWINLVYGTSSRSAVVHVPYDASGLQQSNMGIEETETVPCSKICLLKKFIIVSRNITEYFDSPDLDFDDNEFLLLARLIVFLGWVRRVRGGGVVPTFTCEPNYSTPNPGDLL